MSDSAHAVACGGSGRYSIAMDLAALVAAVPTLCLRTQRLLLRRFTADDIPFVIEQENDRAVMQWIRDALPAAAVCARGQTMAALLAKLGMQREARLREYSRLGGAWRDEFVYGLLAREWPARARAAPCGPR